MPISLARQFTNNIDRPLQMRAAASMSGGTNDGRDASPQGFAQN
jgi:hypothetical protein